MKLKITLFLYAVLAAGFTLSSLNESKRKPRFSGNLQKKLFDHYPWMTPERYYLIRDNAIKYQINPFLLAAIIDKESGGDAGDIGPKIKVKLFRRNNLVEEEHRAVGLMQVMTFYDSARNLKDEARNISKGSEVLSNCMANNSGLENIIKCYNSGHNSLKYNYAYIGAVIADYNRLNGFPEGRYYAARHQED